jgi:signal transduction histidine kinase
MDPANLSARLSVPASGDELQRLSETLNQMLARVEQSMVQMRQFTADASHELRAPMTLIYTAAQFALRRERSADDLRDALQKILREAKRSTEIINQLLWLARSDAGIAPIARVSCDIVPIVKDVVSETAILAADKGLTAETNLPDATVRVDVDEPSFRRLLLILLDNAIKYTPAGGNIKVSLTHETNAVEIKVADTGVGIAEDQLPFIFDRFWRADKVRSREWGGTGLGLAIAREVAESHDAQLSVASTVGQGSTFTIRMRRSAERS